MKYLKLNDLCNVITCGVAKRPDYVDEGIPFLSSLNVKENRLILNKYNFIKEEDHNTLTKYNKPEINDILYTRVGSYGEAAVVNIDFEFSVFVSLTLIKPKHNLINSRYLMWYLNSPKVRDFAKNNTTGVGVKNLNVSVVREYDVPLLPIETQKAIAEKLDKADALRKKDQELLKQYDELAQSIFIDMFGDPVQNEKEWEIKFIQDLVSKDKNSLKRGPFGGALKKEIFVEEGYLVYEQYHALNNDFTMERYFIDDKKFKELESFSVKPKDIIISCSGVYLGKLAIIPDNAKEGIINQALLKLTLNENVMTNDFFVFHFTQPNFKTKYFDSNRGAGIPNFPPMSEFKQFPFITPPLELQNQFADKIKNIEAQKELVKKQAEESENLFQALLQESFNFS